MEDESKNSREGAIFNVPGVGHQPLVDRADHRLDSKRRFTIPSLWYELMGKPAQVYAMPSISRQKCIDVFSPAEFNKKFAPLRDKALYDSKAAQFTSRIGELVSIISVDNANRIRLKDSLLAYIGIGSATEEVVLIGNDNRFEVWSLENKPPKDVLSADYIDILANEAETIWGIRPSCEKN